MGSFSDNRVPMTLQWRDSVCVCVRACVRACVHACVRARVCVRVSVCVCLLCGSGVWWSSCPTVSVFVFFGLFAYLSIESFFDSFGKINP